MSEHQLKIETGPIAALAKKPDSIASEKTF